MNNKFLFTIIAIIVLVAGGFLLTNGDSDVTETPVESNSTVSVPKSTPTIQQTSGRYVDFSEEELVSTADTKQVVFFHAEWCSTCRFYEKEIESAGVPEGVTILKADFDKDDDLKDRYGVTVQSTFVLLDENGEVERTWPFAQGLRGIDDLYSEII